jgi:hypothetical protein
MTPLAMDDSLGWRAAAAGPRNAVGTDPLEGKGNMVPMHSVSLKGRKTDAGSLHAAVSAASRIAFRVGMVALTAALGVASASCGSDDNDELQQLPGPASEGGDGASAADGGGGAGGMGRDSGASEAPEARDSGAPAADADASSASDAGDSGSQDAPPKASCYGAEACNDTGNPIGGKDGYTRIVSESDSRIPSGCRVSTKDQFLACINAATSGDVVYVTDDATIDLTGTWTVRVAAGVTVASGRGRNGSSGGRIVASALPVCAASANCNDSLFYLKGNDVRFTGLRIEGPEPRVTHSTDNGGYHIAIGIQNEYSNLEVDNCEIYGWPYAGVILTDWNMSDARPVDAHIHHNNIWGNERQGYGYGVALERNKDGHKAVALIEANIFDYNRHAIAASDSAGIRYEARLNIVEEHAETIRWSHSFDIHGKDEGDGVERAGEWANMHHNTFKMVNDGDGIEPNVRVRGIPRERVCVHNNWFFHDTMDKAVRQLRGSGNMCAYNNVLGSTQRFEASTAILCEEGCGVDRTPACECTGVE